MPNGGYNTFYILSSLTGDSNFLALQENGSAPADAVASTGWRLEGVGADNYADMQAQVEVAIASFNTTVKPEDSNGPDSTAKDAMRLPNAFSGQFSAGYWVFKFRLIADTAGGQVDGRVRVSLWKGAQANGSDATLVAGPFAGTQVTDLATGTPQTSIDTAFIAAISLTSQYLFFRVAFHNISAIGGMGGDDAKFYIGEGCQIESPYFNTQDVVQGMLGASCGV